MPLPRTMNLLARICRLSYQETRALQLLCSGHSLDAIAVTLDVPGKQARGIVRSGQRKARNARPWWRPARLWEQRAEVAAYWATAERLGRDGRLDVLQVYVPAERNLDTDLLADARAILDAMGNEEMLKWVPASGPRLPGPGKGITPQRLCERWIESLTGGNRRAPGEAMSEIVIESIRKRYHAQRG